jgi:hypothetical protein
MPNKAQHSPLPWKIIRRGNQTGRTFLFVVDTNQKCVLELSNESDSELIVRAVNHADKLAEALRGVRYANSFSEREAIITQALAAYEAAQ